MKKIYLKCVFLLLFFLFSCSKEFQETHVPKGNQQNHVISNDKIDSDILSSLCKEPLFIQAVSISNQKRIIELIHASNNTEECNGQDLQLMQSDDFNNLCKKYDCDISYYLAFELAKTRNERLSLHSKLSIKTKTTTDYRTKCQAIKKSVETNINDAYVRARRINDIPSYCDCTGYNQYFDISVSYFDYILMATFSIQSVEFQLYNIINDLTQGFKYDVSGRVEFEPTATDEQLNKAFQNLGDEIRFIGFSILPHHLATYVSCNKNHTCPICGSNNCTTCSVTPDPEPNPNPGGGSGSGGVNPGTPCEYCGLTDCGGHCVDDIISTAPKATQIFKINRNIPLDIWQQVECCIDNMFAGYIMVDLLKETLNEKINLTLNYNGGCENVFMTNTICPRIYNSALNFIDESYFEMALFHIYQYNYYREYDLSYALNLEFEAKTYIYLSYCISNLGNQTGISGYPEFDDINVQNRYFSWIAECTTNFENSFGMGIVQSDYVDFLTSFSNKVRTEFDYKGMRADVSKEMLSAMFDLIDRVPRYQ